MKERERQIVADKRRVKEIYGNRCANFNQCHSTEKVHIHHILFRDDGRHNRVPGEQIEDKGNYIALCRKCEEKVHSLG